MVNGIEQGTSRLEGYDANGVSLYYCSEDRVSLYNRIIVSRILRLGNVNDLVIIPPLLPVEPITGGLKQYIRTEFGERKVPVYIFDHHHPALFAWFEALKEGRIKPEAILRHFDEHEDGRHIRHSSLSSNMTLPEIASYVRKQLTIDNFIVPAVLSGLVGEFHWIKPYTNEISWDTPFRRGKKTPRFGIMGIDSMPIQQIQQLDPTQLIVDIDLDYFLQIRAQEEGVIKRMRQEMACAGVISIATSPGYIDQERAVELAKKLLS